MSAIVSSGSVSREMLSVDKTGRISARKLCPVVVESKAGTSQLSSAEHRQESSSKRRVHEAVGDGMAAGGREAEKVDEVHRSRRDVFDCAGVVEHEPRLKDVHRRPADEELGHHHEQHLHSDALNTGHFQFFSFYSVYIRHAQLRFTFIVQNALVAIIFST